LEDVVARSVDGVSVAARDIEDVMVAGAEEDEIVVREEDDEIVVGAEGDEIVVGAEGDEMAAETLESAGALALPEGNMAMFASTSS
jgi:hypothetical protein